MPAPSSDRPRCSATGICAVRRQPAMKRCEACGRLIEPAGHMTTNDHSPRGLDKPIVWLGACGCIHKQWVAEDPLGEWRAYSSTDRCVADREHHCPSE